MTDRIVYDENGVEPTGVVGPGDLVEATKDDEMITAPLIEYNGVLFIGQTGRTLDYYATHGFRLRRVERAF